MVQQIVSGRLLCTSLCAQLWYTLWIRHTERGWRQTLTWEARVLEAVIHGRGEGAAGAQLQTRGAGCSPGSRGGSPLGRGNSLCKGPGAGGNAECLKGEERRKVKCHGPGAGCGSSQFFVLRAKRIFWTFTQEAVVPLPRSRSGLHSEKILLRSSACSSVKWVSNCILHRGSGSNEPM